MAVIFDVIGMHDNFHLDEAAAYLFLIKRGEKKFPGINKATIVFDGTGGRNFRDINGDELLEDGVVLIGIGGGMFDEHPGPNQNAKEGECTATLVAKYLGIENEPGIQKLLKFVRDTDLLPVAQPFDISSVVKALHNVYSPEKVMEWAIMGLLAKWRQQEEFCKAEEDFSAANTENIVGPNGKTVKMVTATTDNEQFKSVALNRGAAVIIKKSSSGKVQIFTGHKFGVKLYEICRQLRCEEQRLNGKVTTTDARTLASFGKVEGAEEWYFHEGQMLLNGSKSHPDVLPTKISLEKIQEIVRTYAKETR